MKYDKKYFIYIILVCFILVEIVVGISGSWKRQIAGDEIFSFGLANNTDEYVFYEQRQIDLYANASGWFPAEKYHNYITVQPEDTFSYANVFAKQKADVHPPLYYLLVHTISSFSPDTVNYIGIACINIAAMCGVMIILWLSMKAIYGMSWFTLVPSALWLMSGAAHQLTTYIRMYALLNFWIACIIYLHICLILEKELSWKRAIQIGCVVCLGGLTHYYFYVYTFFLVGTYVCMWLLEHRKNWLNYNKNLMRYITSVVSGGMIALLIFPKAVYHVLRSNVGSQVQGNLANAGLPFVENWNIVDKNVYHGKFIILLLIFALLMGICSILNKTKQRRVGQIDSMWRTSYTRILILLFSSLILYFLLIMKITIYVAWYYISPVFLGLMIVSVLLIDVIRQIGYAKIRSAITFLCLFGSLFYFTTGQIRGITSTMEKHKNYTDMIESLSGYDCIYVSDSWNCLYGNHLPDMAEMDEIKCITPDEYVETDLKELLARRESTENDIVMIFRKVENTESYIKQMEAVLQKPSQMLFEDNKNMIVKF